MNRYSYLIFPLLCLLSCFSTAQSVYDPSLAPFYHGVASGDPLPDRVILWTRVTPTNNPASISVLWQVAIDTSFENIVQYGYGTTNANKDYTLKVEPTALQANTYYYYRFYALGKYSMVGRTKTSPAANATPSQVRLAVASCAEFADGYFTPYRKIAERNDLDAVLQLGDYIYERSGGDVRNFDPDAETVSLSEYRTRHSQYKLDPDLRLAHQRHPFIVVWDDHEFANNAYRDNAGGHNSLFEGSWEARKLAAMQAYFEWQPIRRPEPESNPQRIYRQFSFGNLVELLMLDTRIIGRDQQAFAFIGADDSDRSIMGTAQRDWLLNGLSQATAQWKIIGQQVMFAPFRIAGARVSNDQWDGYTADRQRILDHLMQNNIANTVILTGDIHSAWANDVPYSNYDPTTGAGSATVEFIAPSITSDGFPFEFGEEVILDDNPHVQYANLLGKGYLIVDITPERVQTDYYFVNTIATPMATEYFETAYFVANNERHLQATATPSVLAMPTTAVFPSPELSPDVVKLRLRLLLQGAYQQGGTMSTQLRQNNLLPLSQPFNTAPWQYAGSESFANEAAFPANAVDWVLVELRDSLNADAILYRKAAILLSDGSISSLEGGKSVWIPNLVPYQQGVKVSIHSRHHLATMSSAAIPLPNATVYDFSSSAAMALGNEQQVYSDGVWLQWAGDVQHDGVLNYRDYQAWQQQQGNTGYAAADLNMDGAVDNADFLLWQANARLIGLPALR